jgi:hypothetical protein
MPVEEHPVFVSPKNKKQKIWRYMDFTKYISLLDMRELYFPAQIKLTEQDPFEGSVARANPQFREDQLLSFIKENTKANKTLAQNVKKLCRDTSLFYEKQREFVFVNCWHINDHESAAMWKTYISSNEGVCIVSTYKKLEEELNKQKEPMYIGQVQYLDYESEIIPEGNRFLPAMCKRKSFEYEKELRAVYANLKGLVEKDEPREGVSFPVNPENLIEEVLVSPLSPDWYADLVESITKKLGFNLTVKKSSLSDKPVF